MDRKRLLSVILASLSSISSVGAVKAKRNHSNNSKNLISVNQNRSKKTVIKNNKVTKPAKDKKMSSGKESNSLKENKKNENVTKTQGVKNWIKDNPVKSSIGSLAFSALAAYGGLSILEYILTEPDIVYKDLPASVVSDPNNGDELIINNFRGGNLLFVDDGLGKERINNYVSNIVKLFSKQDPLDTYEYGKVYNIPELYCRFMIVGYDEAMAGKTRCFDEDIVYNTNGLFYVWGKKSTMDRRLDFFSRFYKIWGREETSEWNMFNRITTDNGMDNGFGAKTIRKWYGSTDAFSAYFVFYGSEEDEGSARKCSCSSDDDCKHENNCSAMQIELNRMSFGNTMPRMDPSYSFEEFKGSVLAFLRVVVRSSKTFAPSFENVKFFKEKWWRELLKAYK